MGMKNMTRTPTMKLAVAAVLAASLSVLAYGDVQEFDYKWEHPRLTIVRLQDATDAHDELLFTTEYVLSRCERTFDVEAPALFIEDVLTGDGMAFFRKAPLPHARTDKTPDFRVDARRRRITVNATAYPCVRVPYTGGAAGRVRAATDFQHPKVHVAWTQPYLRA